MREKAAILNDVSQSSTDIEHRRGRQLLAFDQDGAPVGLDQADHQAEKRGLPAAARSDQNGRPARLDREVELAEND